MSDPIQDAASFIRAMFSDLDGGYIEIRPIEERRKDEERGRVITEARRWYPTDEALVTALPSIVATCKAKRWAAFFGVLPRSEQGKGDSASVERGRTLWLDIDFKDFENGESQARDGLRGFPAQPSIVVRSGHGLHAYWLLYEAEPAAALRRYSRALAKALGGDSTFDAARILRLPGSFNLKWPNDPVQVEVEKLEPDARYALTELDEWLDVDADEAGDRAIVDWAAVAEATKGLHADVVAAFARNPALAALLRGEGKPERTRDGQRLDTSRSGYDWSLLTGLARAGVRDPAALRSALVERAILTGRTMSEAGIRRQVENAIGKTATALPVAGLAEHAPGEPRHLTDLGNAGRLVDAFGEDIRRCPVMPDGGWMVWDEKRWRIDKDLGIMRCASKVPAMVTAEEAAIRTQISAEPDEDEAKRLEKIADSIATWAHKSESRAAQESMVTLAKSDRRIIVQKAQLDANRWVLNVPNGTLDLTTGTLRPHSRSDLLTRMAGAPYDPRAGCLQWEAFLSRIMCGRKDLVDFLRRAMGYSLCGTVSEQVFMVCHGSGSNGKGTLINTIKAALGEYATSTSAQTFMTKTNGSIPNDLAALDGTRFVAASETAEGAPLDEQVVKNVTGGDSEAVAARFLHAEWFNYVPQFTVWLGTNHKPIIKGTDNGIWRRIRLIPFDYNFEGDPDKDIHFAARLQAEELSGILAWAVRGCLEWQQAGLQEPPDVLAATQDYRNEMDLLADFLQDRCEVGPLWQVENGALWAAWRQWAEENGEHVRSQRWLARNLKKRGLEQGRGSQRFWAGLKLQPQAVTNRGGRFSFGGCDD